MAVAELSLTIGYDTNGAPPSVDMLPTYVPPTYYVQSILDDPNAGGVGVVLYTLPVETDAPQSGETTPPHNGHLVATTRVTILVV